MQLIMFDVCQVLLYKQEIGPFAVFSCGDCLDRRYVPGPDGFNA